MRIKQGDIVDQVAGSAITKVKFAIQLKLLSILSQTPALDRDLSHHRRLVLRKLVDKDKKSPF